MSSNAKVVESYEIPSKGKIYFGKDVSPIVKIRSMTTRDEMKRQGRTDAPYKALSELLDDCMEEPVGISTYDMSVGDFQYLLHRLRVVTYGKEYDLLCTCPYCLQQSKETINLDSLGLKTFDEKILENFEFDLPISKSHIKLKLQTPRMLDNVQSKVNNDKKTGFKYAGEPAFLYTLVELIDEVDGNKMDDVLLEDWLYNLPMKDVNKIVNKADVINKSIGVDDTLLVKCEVCGSEYQTPFRITNEFFVPTNNF